MIKEGITKGTLEGKQEDVSLSKQGCFRCMKCKAVFPILKKQNFKGLSFCKDCFYCLYREDQKEI